MAKESRKLIANNKKAFHDYFLSDFLECGIVLQGTEIKSLRVNGASLSDSYVIIRNGEMFILGMNIAQYDKGNIFNHEPTRTRKLLLHKEEIEKYNRKVQEKGFTIMASKIYFRNGKAKVEIALAKGKKLYDKREVEKNKSINREIDSHLKMKNQY